MYCDAVIAHILSSDSVRAMTSGRTYPMWRPEGDDLPAIVWRVRHAESTTGIRANVGYWVAEADIECWAREHDSSRALGIAVAEAVDGVRGVQLSGGARIDHVFVAGWRDADELPESGAEWPAWGTILELHIGWQDPGR